MNVTMLVMIDLCVRVRSKNQIIRGRERVFTGKNNLVFNLLLIYSFSSYHFYLSA
jgi:hypothetical protein